MTADPAVEAAQRVWEPWWALPGSEGKLTEAAREALAPIRELHRPHETNDPRSPHDVVCNHCLGPKKWPCPTARLIYPESEL